MSIDLDDLPKSTNSRIWLTTFGDTVALVLTFFVLLYAMSSVNQKSFEALSDTLRDGLNVAASQGKDQAGQEDRTLATFKKFALDLSYLANVLERQLESDELLRRVEVHLLSDRLIISLPSDLLFRPASAVIDTEAMPSMRRLANILSNLRNRIDVHGHTDPTPLKSPRFIDNWDLSMARASAVAVELRRFGYRKPMRRMGFAATRFDEIPVNLPILERNQLARRVDIVIYQEIN